MGRGRICISDERSHSWIGKVTELVVETTHPTLGEINVKIVGLNNSQFEVVQAYDPIPSGVKTHLKQQKRGRKEYVKEDVRGGRKEEAKKPGKVPGHLTVQMFGFPIN